MYWVLPDGRCVCWSVAELAEKKQDELLDGNALKAYETIGNQLDFHPLGMLDDETFESYRDNPGTLEERPHLSCFFLHSSHMLLLLRAFVHPYRAQVSGKGFGGACLKMRLKHVGGPMC